MHNKMNSVIKRLLFVPKCKCCLKPADFDNLCQNCKNEMEKDRIPQRDFLIDKKFSLTDKVYASYYYHGAVKRAVTNAKFKNPASFLNSFINDISIDINKVLSQNNVDIISFVPCHKSKFYSQEFYLPLEMAKRIGVISNIPVTQCVKKIKNTPLQHMLPLAQRKVNLINAFQVTEDVTNKNILIIDDVITTGSTVRQLAEELKLAGALNVYCWVYAYNTDRKELQKWQTQTTSE